MAPIAQFVSPALGALSLSSVFNGFGWVGGDIIASDLAVSRALTAALGEQAERIAETAAAGAAAMLVIVAGVIGRRLRESKSRADPPTAESG